MSNISGREMENSNQKFLERVVSQKALQMGRSFQCQFCVVGFLSGVCLTSLFLAALTSFGTFGFRGISFSTFSNGIPTWNSTSNVIDMVTEGDCNLNPKDIQKIMQLKMNINEKLDTNTSSLYSAWSDLLLNKPTNDKQRDLLEANVPIAPHIYNCKMRSQINQRLDTRPENKTFPPWTTWKGSLYTYAPFSTIDTDEKTKHHTSRVISQGAYPPWIVGSDEENYPLTRVVQRDIWLNQHPIKCNDPNIKFLVADWERLPGFGMGAQMAGMCGLLAIAINEKRVLVTDYYNRADHDECQGPSRSSWSCYFFPEASQECRERAFKLIKENSAWVNGTITGKRNYTSKSIWAGRTPRVWGTPWNYLQPTTDINGTLVSYHRKMDRRWWRAQAVRYLMRFQTEYTCNLLNAARHEAFGWEAAKLVLAMPTQGEEINKGRGESELERFVWSNHKAWMPRPLLSLHVRMGDKACEMKVVEFEEYMSLADRIRKRFPHLNNIWLSTEMQEVIEKTKSYPHWNFYYTKVKRQESNITMATYEASLGRKISTNYPLVNFLMASEADFFVGALGSTWCFLIDGMRSTGGKIMNGQRVMANPIFQGIEIPYIAQERSSHLEIPNQGTHEKGYSTRNIRYPHIYRTRHHIYTRIDCVLMVT